MIDESSVGKIVSGPGEKKVNLFHKTSNWLFEFTKKYRGTLIGLAISLQLLALLLITNYNLLIKDRFPSFSLRNTNAGIFLTILATSYLFSFLVKENALQTIITWLKSNLLTIFGFLYFLTIENPIFVVILIAVLFLLSFVYNRDLFGKDEKPFYITFATIFLFTLQSFALINFLEEDKTQFRSFPDSIISQILSFDKSFWLIFCAFSITLWCVAAFKLKNFSKNLLFGSIFFSFCLEVLIVINSLNFDFFLYWQKTILFVIFWDFIYLPLQSVANQNSDEKYTPKLAVSTFYHLILILLIFFIPLFLK